MSELTTTEELEITNKSSTKSRTRKNNPRKKSKSRKRRDMGSDEERSSSRGKRSRSPKGHDSLLHPRSPKARVAGANTTNTRDTTNSRGSTKDGDPTPNICKYKVNSREREIGIVESKEARTRERDAINTNTNDRKNIKNTSKGNKTPSSQSSVEEDLDEGHSTIYPASPSPVPPPNLLKKKKNKNIVDKGEGGARGKDGYLDLDLGDDGGGDGADALPTTTNIKESKSSSELASSESSKLNLEKFKENRENSAFLSNRTTFQKVLGILLPLIAAICYWGQSFTINLLMNRAGINPMNQFLIRGFEFVLFSKTGIYFSRISHRQLAPKEHTYSKVRAILLLTVDLVMFECLKYMSLQTMIVLFFTYPIFVPFLSRFMLGEAIDLASIIALALCFVGIIFVLQPPFIFGDSESVEDTGSYTFYVGCIVMVGDGLLMGFILTHAIYARAKVPAFLVHDNYGVFCILISTFMLVIVYQDVSKLSVADIFLIFFANVLGYSAMMLQYYASKYNTTTLIGLITYFQIPLTYIGEILFNGLEVHLFDLLGGLIITFSALTLNIYKYMHQRRVNKKLADFDRENAYFSYVNNTSMKLKKKRTPKQKSPGTGSGTGTGTLKNKSPPPQKSSSPPGSPRPKDTTKRSTKSPPRTPLRNPPRSPHKSPHRSPRTPPRSPVNEFKSNPKTYSRTRSPPRSPVNNNK